MTDLPRIVIVGAGFGGLTCAKTLHPPPASLTIIRHAYFGHEDWEPCAPGLKQIEDATDIRHRVLEAFEKAETEADPAERRRLLTFAIVGGGPTGVEMAGAIAELAKSELAFPYRNL